MLYLQRAGCGYTLLRRPVSRRADDIANEGWVPLFNGKNFDGWYTYLPSTGKNTDPKKVFKMGERDGPHSRHPGDRTKSRSSAISRARKNSPNCRIRVEFKWGTKRFVPNNENKRDSGLLYFFNGPDKIWPRALEFQIQETDVGDLWILEGSRITTKIETEGLPMYVLSGPLQYAEPWTHHQVRRFRRPERLEHAGTGAGRG